MNVLSNTTLANITDLIALSKLIYGITSSSLSSIPDSLKTATITDEYNDEGFQINSDQKSLL